MAEVDAKSRSWGATSEASHWQGFGTTSLSMRVTSVGEELKRARQAAGLTPEDIAQRTKIQLAKIEALEEGAYERLPEGIYLDGIIRAYAHELKMDGDRLVVQLRAERAAPRDVAAEPASPVARQAAPATTFGPLRPLAVETDDAGITRDVPPEPAAAPVLLPPRPPRRARRAIPLIALALAFGVGMYLGGAFHPFDLVRDAGEQHASAALDQETVDSGQGVDDAEGTARAAEAAAARRPDDWPAAASSGHAAGAASAPLSDRLDRPERTARTLQAPAEQPSGPAEERMRAPASGLSGSPPPGAAASPPQRPPAATGERPAAAGPLAGAGAAPIDPAPAGAAAPAEVSSRAPATDVSGPWILTTVIERTTYRDLTGREYGYRLELRQDGARVTGVGVKATENGREIAGSAQTPVRVEGIIDGDRVELTLIEKGPQRVNRGRMMLYADGEGHLRGRFATRAPEGSGTAVAVRPGTVARRVP